MYILARVEHALDGWGMNLFGWAVPYLSRVGERCRGKEVRPCISPGITQSLLFMFLNRLSRRKSRCREKEKVQER